jgi:cold shock CspA family protein
VHGVVTEFDEARGLGLMVTDDGESLSFHCVAIADGTRSIAVGSRVAAVRAAGRRGRDEAASVTVEP